MRAYSNGGTVVYQKYNGSSWVGQTAPSNVYQPNGWIRAEIRVDGKPALFERDWKWGNGKTGSLPAGSTVTYGGYKQQVRYIEVRRGAWGGKAVPFVHGSYQCLESNGPYWHFRRTPLNTANGQRTGILGAPQVWLTAANKVPALS